MVHETVLVKISDYFNQRDEINSVYLFGSTVKNRERKESDLDLAVLFNESMDQYRRFQAKLQIANDLEDYLNTKIDIVDLRSADLFFIHQMMKNKMLVFDRDPFSRVSFEVKYRKKFFDHLSIYKQYHRQSRKRLREREGV